MSRRGWTCFGCHRCSLCRQEVVLLSSAELLVGQVPAAHTAQRDQRIRCSERSAAPRLLQHQKGTSKFIATSSWGNWPTWWHWNCKRECSSVWFVCAGSFDKAWHDNAFWRGNKYTRILQAWTFSCPPNKQATGNVLQRCFPDELVCMLALLLVTGWHSHPRLIVYEPEASVALHQENDEDEPEGPRVQGQGGSRDDARWGNVHQSSLYWRDVWQCGTFTNQTYTGWCLDATVIATCTRIEKQHCGQKAARLNADERPCYMLFCGFVVPVADVASLCTKKKKNRWSCFNVPFSQKFYPLSCDVVSCTSCFLMLLQPNLALWTQPAVICFCGILSILSHTFRSHQWSQNVDCGRNTIEIILSTIDLLLYLSWFLTRLQNSTGTLWWHYLFQVFESLNLTAYDLNVDMLDVHAVSDWIVFWVKSEYPSLVNDFVAAQPIIKDNFLAGSKHVSSVRQVQCEVQSNRRESIARSFYQNGQLLRRHVLRRSHQGEKTCVSKTRH